MKYQFSYQPSTPTSALDSRFRPRADTGVGLIWESQVDTGYDMKADI